MTWSTLRLHLWLSFTTTGSCRKSSLCSSLFTRILRLMAVSSLLVLALQSSPDPVLPFLFPFVISEHSWEDRQHQIQDCWVWGETERDDARIRWLLWLDTVWWCEDEYSPADPLPGNVQLVSHILSSQGTPSLLSLLSSISLSLLWWMSGWSNLLIVAGVCLCGIQGPGYVLEEGDNQEGLVWVERDESPSSAGAQSKGKIVLDWLVSWNIPGEGRGLVPF